MAQEIEQVKPAPKIVQVAKKIIERVMGLRVVRALQRYGAARGGQLAGGIAYSAIFAIAGSLTIALTAFSYVLGGNETLRDQLMQSLDAALPGVLQTEQNPSGLLNPADLVIENPVNPASLIAILVLLWTSVSLMSGLRSAILAMFGLNWTPRNPAVEKLADLAGFLTMGLALLASTVLVGAARFFAEPVFEFLGLPGGTSTVLLTVGSYALAFLIDAALIIFLIRVMAGARPLVRDLLIGAATGAIASAVLRYLGTAAVGSVADNKLLAPFAAIATLLLWINLLARLVLIAACVMANPPAPEKPSASQREHLNQTPNFVTESDPATKLWNYDPQSGVLAPNPPEEEERSVPKWRGPRAWWARRRVNRARAALEEAQANVKAAEREYRKRAWRAFYTNTRYTTNEELAKYKDPDSACEDFGG